MTTFERVGMWNVGFVSQNADAPLIIQIRVVGGQAEHAIRAAREILDTVPKRYATVEYMLHEAYAVEGGVYVPIEHDGTQKKAPAPEGEGRVLKMVPKLGTLFPSA